MAAMCPLCVQFDGLGTQAQVRRVDSGDAMDVSCPRCGNFRVQGAVPSDERIRLCLSGLARSETSAGRRLEISPENAVALASTAPAPRTMAAHYDMLLLSLATRCKYPGSETPPFALWELAAEAFLPAPACHEALLQMGELVRVLEPEATQLRCNLMPAGWQRVDELTRQAPRGDSAFVAMWFSRDLKPAYDDGFHAALVDCGYQPPFRVDALEHQERADDPDFKIKIDDRILAEIRRARFVVADATGARPSVYYEAGFAEGLGTPVIWTCSKDREGDMAFDTRQNEHILWSDPTDLRNQLAAKIGRRGWMRG